MQTPNLKKKLMHVKLKMLKRTPYFKRVKSILPSIFQHTYKRNQTPKELVIPHFQLFDDTLYVLAIRVSFHRPIFSACFLPLCFSCYLLIQGKIQAFHHRYAIEIFRIPTLNCPLHLRSPGLFRESIQNET